MYHNESVKIIQELDKQKTTFNGCIKFLMGGIEVKINGKDGIGGLIEEWFGIWSAEQGFDIKSANKDGGSQTFPDYYVGGDGLLEIKTFDANASANFDIANFDAYCMSVSENPERANSDYLIFSYKMIDGDLSIQNIWLKKIWEITCPSTRWPLKTQTKRDMIYNIRPAAWYSDRAQFKTFNSKDEFIQALFSTQQRYSNYSYLKDYQDKVKS